MQIGDCPKCGKRTFVVHEKRSGFGLSYKGECYNCGETRELKY
jgi:hypothetical protein